MPRNLRTMVMKGDYCIQTKQIEVKRKMFADNFIKNGANQSMLYTIISCVVELPTKVTRPTLITKTTIRTPMIGDSTKMCGHKVGAGGANMCSVSLYNLFGGKSGVG